MRLFSFLLTTVLIAALNAQRVIEDLGASYKFPDGLPDGTVITFFFWHQRVSTADNREPAHFYFYDKDVISSWDFQSHDVNAYFRMNYAHDFPLVSNTWLDGHWGKQERLAQQMDADPAWPKGWWRIDVVKLDNYRLNVFCEGYWSGVRTFEKPLDNIRSVYVMSMHSKPQYVEIHVKMPNANIAPLSYDEFIDHINVTRPDFSTVDRKLIMLSSFPIGSRLEMSTMISASGDLRRKPSLVFKSVDGPLDYLLKISQVWIFEDISWAGDAFTHRLHLDSPGSAILPCTKPETRPNGDVVHFILTRTDRTHLKMEVLYKATSPTTQSCVMELNGEEVADGFDRPFHILGHEGALIFHLDWFPAGSEAEKN